MRYEDVLHRIPLEDYDEFDYVDYRDSCMDGFNSYYDCKVIPHTVLQSVRGYYHHGFDSAMDDNGMDKFVAMIAGMLFMIAHNEVDPQQAYATAWDIRDFETGNYDDLFRPDDLKLLKSDIKKVKDYLDQHPELLKKTDGGVFGEHNLPRWLHIKDYKIYGEP